MTREVIFEFKKFGRSVKVTVLDCETLLEVTIVGDAAAGEAQMKKIGLQKLEYMLEKRRQQALDEE
ncbi:MAG: hypothetical protein P4M00_13960 [Azospirillaceae bacterium]|nr:hypothetical protein [Azospirillaceae bacterium]